MVLHSFEKISADLGVEIKSINTVVEEWPTQLKLQIGQEEAERRVSFVCYWDPAPRILSVMWNGGELTRILATALARGPTH